MVVAWVVLLDDSLSNQVLYVEVHLEYAHHSMMGSGSVKAGEQLACIGLELESYIVVCHSGFDFKILCHQIKVVVIKIDYQHHKAFFRSQLFPRFGAFLSKVLRTILTTVYGLYGVYAAFEVFYPKGGVVDEVVLDQVM